ncbi:hypothetical protein LOTGIDRAFT_231337 [Lottia gigantea]|uniref:tRNA-specific adenosine deaminase 1 n=1 Tax=Lottia gigantea TaxID=225164 RepID=V4AXC3_LOTGI|nr:hypothetical protein LOTGIDRAFT_231337 [Lottia gigantea]ESO98221.1 hypothetical protein LOTGIDRAFT_231337 [Lottia gigantea]
MCEDIKCCNSQFADRIAELTYKQFNELPKTGKPQKDKEWTLLSSIVMSVESDVENAQLEVVSMGTGSKCLGRNKLSKNGDVINDSHSEIITRRGFLRFLYHELEQAYKGKESLVFNPPNEENRCTLKKNVKFHLFSSHTPCGDASIFPKSESNSSIEKEKSGQKRLQPGSDNTETPNKKKKLDLMESQKEDSESLVNERNLNVETDNAYKSDCSNPNENLNADPNSDFKCESSVQNDSKGKVMSGDGEDHSERYRAEIVEDIHRTGAKCVPGGVQDSHGDKVDYHTVGALRIKPGRGDRTICLSCSDKIARWCVVGIQGALLSHFLDKPIYLDSIIIGKCPYNKQAMRRSLIDRVSFIESFNEPVIYQSSLLFQYSRFYQDLTINTQLFPTSAAIVWYKEGQSSFIEVSINGKKQGVTSKNSHKPQSRCKVCCIEMLRRFFKLKNSIEKLPSSLHCISEKNSTYQDVKIAASEYQSRLEILKQTVFSTWIKKPNDLIQFKLD